MVQLISSSGFFGADNVLLELSKNLHALGLKSVVGVFRDFRQPHLEIAEAAGKNGLPTVVFPCKGRMDLSTVLAIKKYMMETGTHLVHSHGYKSNIYALAASYGRPIARVSTCHNWPSAQIKMKLYAALDKSILNGFDKVVAVSDKVKDALLKYIMCREKIATVYNGIDIAKFGKTQDEGVLRRELGIPEDYCVIGTVGRLAEEKGHFYLMEAAKSVLQEQPKTVFLIVGDGPWRKRLEAKSREFEVRLRAKSALVQRPFVFAGVRKEMPAVYSAMDIFVLPSLREGLPMVLLEAMASRKPVLATSVGAVPKVVRSGVSGMLVPPADSTALSKGIIELMGNPKRAKMLAENGRLRVEEEFSSRVMTEKYIEIYEAALRRKKVFHI